MNAGKAKRSSNQDSSLNATKREMVKMLETAGIDTDGMKTKTMVKLLSQAYRRAGRQALSAAGNGYAGIFAVGKVA